jgi:ribosome-associated protein
MRAVGRRATPTGVLIIEATRYRTQARNRADAISRFVAMLEEALKPPKLRRKTSASSASKERRLQSKKIRGRIKRIRENALDD